MNGRTIEIDGCCTWSNFEQGTPEWLQSRCGLLTASRMGDIGTASKRDNLKLEILAERFTGTPAYFFANAAMKWGTEHEDQARQTYSEFTGRQVQQCGLAVSTKVEYLGASVDGLVEDGLIEIKCPTSQTFFKWVIDGQVPEQHKPQMMAQMVVTGRNWCDFVAFDPRYPAEQDLFIRRFTPYQAELDQIEAAARKFLAEVAVMEKMFINAQMV
jgi:putative phage-type endonuclease